MILPSTLFSSSMKINKDAAFSCILWGTFCATTVIGCAIQAVEWMLQGQWLRGAALIYIGCIPGVGLYAIWDIFTEGRGQ